MKILFIGDIVGKIGRKTVTRLLPKIKKRNKIDFCIANGENAAHGYGMTEITAKEMMDAGVDFFTLGDHSFKRMSQIDVLSKFPAIRPANFPPDVPGKGYKVVTVNNYKVLIINLIGRVFMKRSYDCPFREADKILANFAKEKLSAIIIDIHAEATSEKITLKNYLDGRISAIFGTHTHVMTADQQITKKGTAYITDAGMCGYADGSIGIDSKSIIKTFFTEIEYPHVIPENGRTIFNGIIVDINPKTAKAESITPIIEYTNIK